MRTRTYVLLCITLTIVVGLAALFAFTRTQPANPPRNDDTPKIVKETVVVEKEVERVVKETVIVEKPIEKVVEQNVVVNVGQAQVEAQQPQPTATTIPTLPPTATPPVALECCPPNDGICWSYDNNAETMTWYGASDGSCDIHQAMGLALDSIRGGFTAHFTTTVKGVLLITVGEVNGTPITGTIEITLPSGDNTVTSPGPSGGFRWTPLEGIGWRK